MPLPVVYRHQRPSHPKCRLSVYKHNGNVLKIDTENQRPVRTPTTRNSFPHFLIRPMQLRKRYNTIVFKVTLDNLTCS